MRRFIVGLLTNVLLISCAQAQVVTIRATIPRGAISSACSGGVVPPGRPHFLHQTSYRRDRVVGAHVAPCCNAACTQILSTTRLQPARKPGRT